MVKSVRVHGVKVSSFSSDAMLLDEICRIFGDLTVEKVSKRRAKRKEIVEEIPTVQKRSRVVIGAPVL